MRLPSSWLCLAAAALLGLAGCGRPVPLVLQPEQWDFGTIAADSPVQQELKVTNSGRRKTEVRLISTCACLTIEPNDFALTGAGSAMVLLRYDPSEDEGEIAMQVVVRSGKGAGRQVLRAFGRVLPGAASAQGAAEPLLRSSAAERPQLFIEYFYDPGCKGCELLLVRQMIGAQLELDIRLQVAQHHISEPEIHREYLGRLRRLGVEERAYPALLFGDIVLQGDEEIEREFKKVLQGYLDEMDEGSPR